MTQLSEQFTNNHPEQIVGITREVAIVDQLLPLVSEERLAANALTYPYMQEELTPREERQAQAIKARLGGMPLVHGVSNLQTLEKITREGLKPVALLGEEVRGSTFPMDISLGLDQYVFLNWGKPDELFYGTELIEVDTAAVLANSIVTPHDIMPSGAGPYKEKAYGDLPDDIKARLDKAYFGRMVTGNAWLEIVARQVLRFAQRVPGFPFPVDRHEFLGEIKHLGPIDPSLIRGVTSIPDDQARYLRNASMLQHGIAFDATEATLTYKKDDASSDPEEAEDFQRTSWDDIMSIE